MAAKARPLFDPQIVMPAINESFKKLNPIHMWKNPVMFVTEVGAALTTLDLFFTKDSHLFVAQITIWLWFTVIFANFAEAMAEGRGKAQADALRKSRTKTNANKLGPNGAITSVAAETLRKGDIFVVTANELIAADGEIIEGAATVKACLDQRLLINCTHGTVIRLLPAINLTEEQAHEGCDILADVLKKQAGNHLPIQ